MIVFIRPFNVVFMHNKRKKSTQMSALQSNIFAKNLYKLCSSSSKISSIAIHLTFATPHDSNDNIQSKDVRP